MRPYSALRASVPVVLAAAVVGGGFAAPAVAAGPSTSMAEVLAPQAAAFAAASPSDAALQGLSDEDLVVAAVRCTAFDSRTYCLHLGWMDAAPDAKDLRSRVEASAVQAAASADGTQGDLALSVSVRRWAAADRPTRVAAEQAELSEALAGLGKLRLFDLMLAGQPVPETFWKQYPETDAWGKTLLAARAKPITGPVTNVFDRVQVGSDSRAQKQSRSYWCGPTSMVDFAWNDPSVGNTANFSSQTYWAGQLGTTTDGTAITSVASRINSRLTWDNRVGAYVVVSIVGKRTNYNWWRDLLISHMINSSLGAPIQMHPMYKASNNTWGRTTSGHLNVARGYDISDPRGNPRTDHVRLYEPAFGSAVPAVTWQPLDMQAWANDDNASFRNIAY